MISEHTGACRLLGVLRRVPRALHRIAPGMVATSVGLPLAFAIALCPAQAQDTIKIGVPAPLSGSYQNAGTDVVDGARLAVEQINAAGGVRGRMLELVPQDDACDPDVAAKATTQLVATGVVAVAGGYCSSAALPELRVLHDRHIPYVLDAHRLFRN